MFQMEASLSDNRVNHMVGYTVHQQFSTICTLTKIFQRDLTTPNKVGEKIQMKPSTFTNLDCSKRHFSRSASSHKVESQCYNIHCQLKLDKFLNVGIDSTSPAYNLIYIAHAIQKTLHYHAQCNNNKENIMQLGEGKS